MGPSAGYEPVSCIFILAWLMELSPVHGQEDVAPPARGDESRTTNSSFMQAGKMCLSEENNTLWDGRVGEKKKAKRDHLAYDRFRCVSHLYPALARAVLRLSRAG